MLSSLLLLQALIFLRAPGGRLPASAAVSLFFEDGLGKYKALSFLFAFEEMQAWSARHASGGARWGKEKKADILNVVKTAAVQAAADTAMRMAQDRKQTGEIYTWKVFKSKADLDAAIGNEDRLQDDASEEKRVLLFRRRVRSTETGVWSDGQALYDALDDCLQTYCQEACIVLDGTPVGSAPAGGTPFTPPPPLHQQMDDIFQQWDSADSESEERGPAIIQGSYPDFLADHIRVQEPYRRKLASFCAKEGETMRYLALLPPAS